VTRLRYKKLSSGKFSIYTEKYIPTTQKREYKFLKLYVTKDYSKENHIVSVDIETLDKAKKLAGIKDKVTKKVIVEQDGIEYPFSTFFNLNSFCELSKKKMINEYYFSYIGNREVDIREIDKEWVKSFENYLHNKGLSVGTVQFILMKIRLVLNKALSRKLIKENPLAFEDYKFIPRKKVAYLSNEEISLLEQEPAPFNEVIKDMFLFSCYTGLRLIDYKNLGAEQVALLPLKNHYVLILNYQQSKDKFIIELDEKATEILLKYLKKKQVPLFGKHPDKGEINKKIKLWCALAGIKEVSFQSARDSYAIKLLKEGYSDRELARELGLKGLDHTLVYKEFFNNGNNTIQKGKIR
jgi:integrase